MQNHNWTQRQRELVFRLVKKGNKYQEIAEKFGVSEGAIAAQVSIKKRQIEENKKSRLRKKVNQLRKAGAAIDLSSIQIEKVVDGWNDKQRNLALSLWKKGAKYNELAEAFGVTRGSIASQIHIARKKSTKPGKVRSYKKRPAIDISNEQSDKVIGGWTEEQKQRVYKLWQDGVNYDQMASIFGVSRGAVAGQVHQMRQYAAGKVRRRPGRPSGRKNIYGPENIQEITKNLLGTNEPLRQALIKTEVPTPLEIVTSQAENIIRKNNIHISELPDYVAKDYDKNQALKMKILFRLKDVRKQEGKITRRLIQEYNYTDEKLSRVIRGFIAGGFFSHYGAKKPSKQLLLPKIEQEMPQYREIRVKDDLYEKILVEASRKGITASDMIEVLFEKYARFTRGYGVASGYGVEKSQNGIAQEVRGVTTELLRDIVNILKENNILPSSNGLQS